MADLIRYPIVVAEGLDVSLFSSNEEAEEYLNGVNVAGGACVAFDAEGRALRLEATGVQKNPLSAERRKVRIALAEDAPNHAEQLRRVLHDYLQACGQPLGPEAALPDLIRRCRSLHLHRE